MVHQEQFYCTACGKTTKIGQRFCTSCGAKLSGRKMVYQEQFYCPACGKAIKIGQRFCTSCRAKLSDNLECPFCGELYDDLLSHIRNCELAPDNFSLEDLMPAMPKKKSKESYALMHQKNKIIIQFNSQSKSKNISKAIKIAKKLNGELDGKYYKLFFNSINDENLLVLSSLVEFLSGSHIFIDGEDCGRPYHLESRINSIVDCYDDSFCNGNCSYKDKFELKIAKEFCNKFKEPIKTKERKNGKKMNIIFQFNSKSRGGDVPEAIKIAKSLKSEFDGKYYKVFFDSVSNENLLLLHNLVGSLSGTRFFVNGEELEPYILFSIFNCPQKPKCDGKCIYVYHEPLSTTAKKYCKKFNETLSIKKPIITYNGCEVLWINNEDDPTFPKNPDNKYVLIDSPRGFGPGSIIGVEMEKADLIFDAIKYSMMDEEESIPEEKGFVLNMPFIGIIDISKVEGLEELTELKRLDLSSNEIFEIKGLEKLINLEYLDLGGNEISEIKELENLINLKGLILGANKINEIRGLENLVNLIYLDISENPISEIKGLENLVNLKHLVLNDTIIEKESLNRIAEENVHEELKRVIKENNLMYSYYRIPNYAQKSVEYCQRKKVKYYREEKEKIKKIEKMLIETDCLSLDTLRNTLKMDTQTFSNKILDWSIEYGFQIDGDYLIIQKDTISEFINELERHFAIWNKMESEKHKKI